MSDRRYRPTSSSSTNRAESEGSARLVAKSEPIESNPHRRILAPLRRRFQLPCLDATDAHLEHPTEVRNPLARAFQPAQDLERATHAGRFEVHGFTLGVRGAYGGGIGQACVT